MLRFTGIHLFLDLWVHTCLSAHASARVLPGLIRFGAILPVVLAGAYLQLRRFSAALGKPSKVGDETFWPAMHQFPIAHHVFDPFHAVYLAGLKHADVIEAALHATEAARHAAEAAAARATAQADHDKVWALQQSQPNTDLNLSIADLVARMSCEMKESAGPPGRERGLCGDNMEQDGSSWHHAVCCGEHAQNPKVVSIPWPVHVANAVCFLRPIRAGMHRLLVSGIRAPRASVYFTLSVAFPELIELLAAKMKKSAITTDPRRPGASRTRV